MKIPSVLFVLPVAGGAGGAHSVVQEVMGLAKLGVRAEIAVNASNYTTFMTSYPELGQLRIGVHQYGRDVRLSAHMNAFDVTVATINTSVAEIDEARRELRAGNHGDPKIAYYIQDYEPLFYAPRSEEWKMAFASYTLIDDAVLFAKTDWLREIVYANHGVQVHKVDPSIDHDIYFPSLGRQGADLSIVAMLRPDTPRRAPRRTLRILEMLADELDGRVSIQVFGVGAAGLEAADLSLSSRITNHGVLLRRNVPNLMRMADLFLDLSDYQAFGRTALEGMACACVPVVPVLGGTSEYAVHAQNSYVVDTRSDDAILEAVRSFVQLTPDARAKMRHNALATAANFTITKAALSELQLFCDMVPP